MFTETMKRKIQETASKLSIPYEWLYNLIRFESAGTFDPFVKNPYSSARGLIQIIDSTAKLAFGVDSLTLSNRYPTFESYMDNVVYPYLKRYAPYPTKQSLYMQIFLPSMRNVPPNTPIPARYQSVNAGIITVQDYIDHADRKLSATVKDAARKVQPLLIMGMSASIVYYGLKLLVR